MPKPQSCAQLLNSVAVKGEPKSIGHAEAVHNVLDELDCFGCAVFCEWFVFDPLGELVNCHEDVFETALCFLEGSYLIQPPAGERLKALVWFW